MKKIVLLVLICLSVGLISAQSWEESGWNYEEASQDLHRKKYFINLNLLNMEMASNDGFRLTGELKIYANPLKKMWVEGSYLKTYFSLQEYLSKDCETCENKYKKHGKLEVGARFAILNKISLTKEKVAYSTNYTTTHIITKYNVYTIPKRSVFAVRGGLYTLNHMASTEWLDKDILKERLTNYKNNGIYGGLSFSTLKNAEFKSERNTTVSVGYFHDYYADILFSLGESIDDIWIQGKPHPVLWNTDNPNAFQTGNLGFRFGYNSFVIINLVNLSFGVEVGYHPGIDNNLAMPILARRLYAGWKFGMSFSF